MIGRTEQEAQAIFAELNEKIDTTQAFTVLSDRLGTDMSVYPLDAPVPELPETEHLKSRAALLLEMARRERLSLRELYHRVAAARGHLLLIGGPLQIADVVFSAQNEVAEAQAFYKGLKAQVAASGRASFQ